MVRMERTRDLGRCQILMRTELYQIYRRYGFKKTCLQLCWIGCTNNPYGGRCWINCADKSTPLTLVLGAKLGCEVKLS
jgi:hypothetical protein